MIGGMSGSAQADAAVDSKVIVPVMRKHGYSDEYASALTAASSRISPILPPSIGLILCGVLTDVSIGDRFVGGVLPALLIAGALAGTVWIIARVEAHPRSRDTWPKPRELFAGFHLILALLMPVLLLVGLRIGVFTSTELSTIAVLYALVVSLVHRELSWRDLPKVFVDAALTTGILMVILTAASVFSIVVAFGRIPDQLAGLFQAVWPDPLVMLLLMSLLLLILGAVIDAMSLIIIMTPVLAPIAVAAGVDPGPHRACRRLQRHDRLHHAAGRQHTLHRHGGHRNPDGQPGAGVPASVCGPARRPVDHHQRPRRGHLAAVGAVSQPVDMPHETAVAHRAADLHAAPSIPLKELT